MKKREREGNNRIDTHRQAIQISSMISSSVDIFAWRARNTMAQPIKKMKYKKNFKKIIIRRRNDRNFYSVGWSHSSHLDVAPARPPARPRARRSAAPPAGPPIRPPGRRFTRRAAGPTDRPSDRPPVAPCAGARFHPSVGPSVRLSFKSVINYRIYELNHSNMAAGPRRQLD